MNLQIFFEKFLKIYSVPPEEDNIHEAMGDKNEIGYFLYKKKYKFGLTGHCWNFRGNRPFFLPSEISVVTWREEEMEKVSERFLLQDGIFALLPVFKLDKKGKIGLPEHFSDHSVFLNKKITYSIFPAVAPGRDPSHFVGPSLLHGRGWPWAIKMKSGLFCRRRSTSLV